jgi:predicted ATPase
VSLAPLNSAESIVSAIADAIGFTFYEGGEPEQQLLNYLRGKTALLVMDNYEHLLEGARVVKGLLRAAPRVRVLATSRIRLNLGGEYRFPISGMAYPDWMRLERGQDDPAQYCAVKLFVQGARRAKPDFELTEENVSGVSKICQLVEGIPLAIRLAASWVPLLSPQEIASELTHSLDMLATDRRDVPARQRSMQATLDHTWRLLTDRQRELLPGLSVFRGGFSREAAQQVTGASLLELMGLADRSLLQPSLPGRYEIHELSRQYALGRLDLSSDAGAAIRDRHCAYYVAAVSNWGADLKGARQQAALAEIEADVENVMVAWKLAITMGDVERVEQALDGLCRFFDWRGRIREGQVVCQEAADMLAEEDRGDQNHLRARVLYWSACFSGALGYTDIASEKLGDCLHLLDTTELDTRAEKASVLAQSGRLAFQAGDNAKARHLFEESLVMCRELGDRWGEGAALEGLGTVAWSLGAYAEAQRWAEKSLSLRQSLGDIRGCASSLELMGDIAAYSGEMEESVRLQREIIAMRTKIGDQPGIAHAVFSLATGLIWSGEFSAAQSLFEESIEYYRDLGSSRGVARSNAFMGWIDAMLGSYETARRRFDESLLVYRDAGQREVGRMRLFLGLLTLAHRDYAAAQSMLQEAASLFEAIGQRNEWTVAIAGLGYVALAQRRIAEAQRFLYKALESGARIHDAGLMVLPIPTAALLLAEMGGEERAVEIYALASRYPHVAKSRFYDDIIGKHIAAVEATLPPDVVSAAQERGRARDLWETAKELLAELEGRKG